MVRFPYSLKAKHEANSLTDHAYLLNTHTPGLKSQHVTAIEWLAKATDAYVDGLTVGSHTLVFKPKKGPSTVEERKISIRADSAAASTMLIFQTVFPFLLFAGDEAQTPIDLDISGGTNVSKSLSYEYLDQVLLPTLESWFGLRVERKLLARGWSVGSASRGLVSLKIFPLRIGSTLKLKENLQLGKDPNVDFEVTQIDASIVVPKDMHKALMAQLRSDLEPMFPGVEITFPVRDDSCHDTRMYVLLVAKSDTLRWGRDYLFEGQRAGKTKEVLAREISDEVSQAFHEEVTTGGIVDEFLQDQLVVFQALAEGETSFPRDGGVEDEGISGITGPLGDLTIGNGPRRRKEKAQEPFGEATDSTHTKTVRWVTAELLPKVAYFNKGKICEGVAAVSGRP